MKRASALVTGRMDYRHEEFIDFRRVDDLVHSKAVDAWSWLIANEPSGKLTAFGRVKLTRK
jgi:hypothetical protein